MILWNFTINFYPQTRSPTSRRDGGKSIQSITLKSVINNRFGFEDAVGAIHLGLFSLWHQLQSFSVSMVQQIGLKVLIGLKGPQIRSDKHDKINNNCTNPNWCQFWSVYHFFWPRSIPTSRDLSSSVLPNSQGGKPNKDSWVQTCKDNSDGQSCPASLHSRRVWPQLGHLNSET